MLSEHTTRLVLFISLLTVVASNDNDTVSANFTNIFGKVTPKSGLRSTISFKKVSLNISRSSVTPRAGSVNVNASISSAVKCRTSKDKCVVGAETHRHAGFYDRNCYCDSDCTVYDDCCANYEAVQESIGAYTFGYERNQRPKLFECVYVKDRVEQVTNPSIYIFNKCPSSWSDEETKSLCETGNSIGVNITAGDRSDWLSSPSSSRQFVSSPGWLVSSVSTRRTYRNYFCAVCNGESDPIWWPVTVFCQHRDANKSEVHSFNVSAINSFSQLLAISTDCTSFLRMPLPDDVTYCMRVIDTCPAEADQSNGDVKQCYDGPHSHVYSHQVLEKYASEQRMRSELATLSAYVFKNEACARCNSVNANETEKCHTALPIKAESTVYKPVAFSFAALFEPRRPQNIIVKAQSGNTFFDKNVNVRCPPGTVFVPYLLSCVGNRSLNSTNISDYSSLVLGSICDAYVEASFTISLLVASCVALIVQIFTYCMLRPLRNVQGNLVLCFSGNLLAMYVVNVVALIPEPGTWPCMMMAAVCHFILLSVFFWMQALIFDVWQTIRHCNHNRLSLGVSEEAKSVRRLLKYGAYCYGCPLAFIAICFALEFTNGDHLRPRYGAEGNCWLSDSDGRLFFFGLPVTIVVSCTCLLLICVCVNVSKIANETNEILRQANTRSLKRKNGSNDTLSTSRQTASTTHSEISAKKRVFLFGKLCLIGGLLWLAGLLYELTGSCVFNYIFTICCASQGIAVSLIFLCTKKVLKLARRRFKIGKPSMSSASQQANSHTQTGNSRHSLHYSVSNNVHARVLRKCHSNPGNIGMGVRSVDLDLDSREDLLLHAAKSASNLSFRPRNESNSIIQRENRQNIAKFIDDKIDNYKFGAKAEQIVSDCNVQHESVRHKDVNVIPRLNLNRKDGRKCNTVY